MFAKWAHICSVGSNRTAVNRYRGIFIGLPCFH
jgi:hypothetical protein